MTRDTPELVTAGETMALLSPPEPGPLRHARSLDLRVGGAESNLAIGAARLGVRAAWIGRVGDDELGRLVRSTLAGEGVDVSHAVTDPAAPTGLMLKERRAAGVTRVTYYRAGSAGSRLEPADIDPELIASARVLHVTGITPALSESARDAVRLAVEAARAAGVAVSVDFNYRARLWPADAAAKELRRLAEAADVLFATEDEARLVVDAPGAEGLAGALSALGPAEVLIKRGGRGAVAYAQGTVHEVPPYPVDVVDPVGAGDAFGAAYLAELVRGRPVPERLRTAALAGALAVTVPGDWEGLPTRDDLDLIAGGDVRR
ncbi:sugar kinase [Bailinhaonella thermotolerans]|uniref:Sugar kinase n=1 Tax=Bailinhaonella thermotolerans TaxID=1070861 RepID=A0A3A4AWJ2_9ACTN|nr:sugar kinase [Bailinhaonella thermotolerans]RJL34295.1 sugar kinase [Bailinhaonella thermotolerans]